MSSGNFADCFVYEYSLGCLSIYLLYIYVYTPIYIVDYIYLYIFIDLYRLSLSILQVGHTLPYVFFADNPLGEMGTASLVTAITSRNILTHLSLSRVDIVHAVYCGTAFGELLKANFLQFLDLSGM